MSESARTIITSLDNLADAVGKSVINGQAQFDFSGRATNVQDSALPTHCLSSGTVDDVVIAAYEMDPNYFVSDKVGRDWRGALADYPGGPLYQWTDPNE